MAWQLLPTNYTNASWSGLKKYNQIDNQDGTVSFQDVTVYSQKDTSFFGALEANRMNEAINAIMDALEGNTDLYSAFQAYFTTQQTNFETAAEALQSEFEDFVALKTTEVGTNYSTEINQFKAHQEELFALWFNFIKGQLGTDPAGNLQNQITDITDTLEAGDFGLQYTTSEITSMCDTLDCTESSITFV